MSSAIMLSPDQLKDLVKSGLWKDSSELWNKIALRSMDLGLRQAELGEEFWSYKHANEGAQFQLFHQLFDDSEDSETSKFFFVVY